AANLAADLGTTIGTAVNGENLHIAYASTGDAASAHVGGYPITGQVADGTGKASDYNVTLTKGTLTVTPVTLTLPANDAGRMYGAANPAFSATISGFVNGDDASVVQGNPVLTTAADANSPVGDYPISAAKGTLSAADYLFAFAPGTLHVTRATP